MMRAAHLLLDGEPKIFSDHFASKLAGFESEAQLKVGLERFLAAVAAAAGRETAEVTFRYLRAGMTLRSRYTEDELERAIERGLAQYVILGAGLDSFAYRQRAATPGLRVFEVDLPCSQHWKRERLRTLGMAEPAGLVARLATSGFAEAVDFGPEQARARYFAGRTDDLVVPRLSRIMKARVAR